VKRLDRHELAVWCSGSGYELVDWRPSLPHATRSLRIPLPRDPQSVPDLADSLVVFATGCDLVVWLRDWTIWNDRSQEIGLRHLELLTGDTHNAGDLEAYLIPASEWREAIALVLLAMLYGWDAQLLFGNAAALFDISHDCFVSAVIRVQGPLKLDGWATSASAANA
jgi:hypothetical protein